MFSPTNYIISYSRVFKDLINKRKKYLKMKVMSYVSTPYTFHPNFITNITFGAKQQNDVDIEDRKNKRKH